MKQELVGIFAKLDRATEHLNTLDTEVVKFIEGDTYRTFGEYEPQTTSYRFKIAISEPPDPRIGVVLGDVVHNLRSALDHLVWQLVLKSNGTPGQQTKFPVFDSPTKFAEQVTQPGSKGKPNPLFGLEGTPAWDAIENLQPYKRGNDNRLLAALHALSIEDKHHVVPQTVAAVEHPGPQHRLNLTPNEDAGEILEVIVHAGKPLEDGTDLVTIRLAPTGPQPEVVMKGKLTLGIGFGEDAVRSEVLPMLASLVIGVVRDFQKQFF